MRRGYGCGGRSGRGTGRKGCNIDDPDRALAIGDDPVKYGLVTSLGHPGDNMPSFALGLSREGNVWLHLHPPIGTAIVWVAEHSHISLARAAA
jgi:hypothetical protein